MTWGLDNDTYRYAEHRDLPSLVEMLADPEVGRWLWFTPATPELIATFFTPLLDEQARVLESGETPQTAVFAVDDPDGDFLGQGAVVAVEGSPGGFEIGYQLNQRAWGRGVGTRLSQFLRAYAVHCCDAHRIEASCLESNRGSCRILENLGLNLEGVRPGYRLKEGVRHTELFFGAEVSCFDSAAIARIAEESGLI